MQKKLYLKIFPDFELGPSLPPAAFPSGVEVQSDGGLSTPPVVLVRPPLRPTPLIPSVDATRLSPGILSNQTSIAKLNTSSVLPK